MKEPEVWIGIMVILVIVAGFALLSAQNGLTGQVIADPCDCVPGAPVCGAIDSHIVDYASSCHAVCAGARIVFEDRCGNIPLN
jgi:hypothetical protein